ncbi:FAR1 DNA binding domain, zinc finger, SWIM-type, MULE transposase domain containing protein [Tanacetum coccineum]
MDEFSLNENKWLSDMFEMHDRCIPAYFRNEPMSGLMCTMLSSESENHFFGQLTSTRLSLFEFVSHYDTAMDLQRFIYAKNNHDSKYTAPDLKTGLLVEKEAAKLYTKTLFYDVREEVYSSLMHCYALNVHEGESHRHFVICDIGADFKRKGVVVEVKYEVYYVPSEGKINYSCLRWSKNAMTHKSVGCTVEVWSSSNAVNDSDSNSIIRDIYGKVEESVNQLNHMYASLLGVTEPEEVTIHLPNGIRNKGTGHDKRYVSKSEISSTQSNKPKRLCRNCGKHGYNDSRNFPKKKKPQDNRDVDMEDMEEDA